MYLVLKGGFSYSDKGAGTLFFSHIVQMSHSLCARELDLATRGADVPCPAVPIFLYGMLGVGTATLAWISNFLLSHACALLSNEWLDLFRL